MLCAKCLMIFKNLFHTHKWTITRHTRQHSTLMTDVFSQFVSCMSIICRMFDGRRLSVWRYTTHAPTVPLNEPTPAFTHEWPTLFTFWHVRYMHIYAGVWLLINSFSGVWMGKTSPRTLLIDSSQSHRSDQTTCNKPNTVRFKEPFTAAQEATIHLTIKTKICRKKYAQFQTRGS